MYDTWGKMVSIQDANGNEITDPNHIGHVNPIRYRGYYYDNETEYYYLQTRYYNPEWGRFLNADGIACLVGGVGGNNMFAYCENNPIMFADHGGQFVLTLTAVLWGVLAIESGVGAIITASQIDWSGFSFSLPEMSPVVTAPAPYLKPPVVQTPASTYPAAGAVAQAQTKPKAKSQAKTKEVVWKEKKQSPAIYGVCYIDGFSLQRIPGGLPYSGNLTIDEAVKAYNYYTSQASSEYAFCEKKPVFFTKGATDASKLIWAINIHDGFIRHLTRHKNSTVFFKHYHRTTDGHNEVRPNGYHVHFWFGSPI